MTVAHWVVSSAIRGIFRILCRVDDGQLASVPLKGPLILVSNHINFVEIPVVFTHLLPRQVTGFAKSETWDNPIMGRLFDLWGAIPIRRGEADLDAMRSALDELEGGNILAIAPEGTRSGNGQLQRAHPGVVTLALRSGAPILPLVYYGNERFNHNVRHLRRTDFHIVVGRSFRLHTGGRKITREVRQKMTDEIMYEMARLLPPSYRGVYSDLNAASTTFLQFPPVPNDPQLHMITAALPLAGSGGITADQE